MQEHINLVKSIRGEGEYLHEGKQVAESTMTAIMGRMSAYTGKKLTYREALASNEKITPSTLSFELEYPVAPIPRPMWRGEA